jgi:hypothetical protein
MGWSPVQLMLLLMPHLPPPLLLLLLLLFLLIAQGTPHKKTLTFKHTMHHAQGILSGCWVVGFSWVAESLERHQQGLTAGFPVPEGPHEVTADSSGGRGGPARGRERAGQGGHPVLHGWRVLVSGERHVTLQ